jgi:protein-L-isoaspartate(D-aspartate) O-methyltransferase
MQTAQVREQMIEQQVRAWDVLDERVLAAMRRVPRDLFVPAGERYRAYADAEVPLARGQHMLRPSVVGRLLQALLPHPHERVLEVGAGTGFVTACLRGLAGGVRSLELYPELAESARANLAALGVRGTEVLDGDALRYESADSYDVIALTGSLPIYDARFERLLATGGRLFVVVGAAPVMEARLVQRIAHDEWRTLSLFETVIDALVHAPRPAAFTF